MEEAREAEMQLHRERGNNSLSERDERHKVSDMRRSPPRGKPNNTHIFQSLFLIHSELKIAHTMQIYKIYVADIIYR